ncbi:MAG TPA: 16S rRNA (cytidine(1402)-2'-O)-methyltransferase [Candidatus Omnitrophota bacterium]|nr:16S rRNA (cytidine(1402)-2'-O)-methyltransferase [Candidatus Omnitrophota bacterium]HQO57714.1 16S rRNA (cytidine(1402)-2'-O)-methyltransferase [Candidatus Omnitrophota bacterium]HQP12648.1 16S rRNA (cytidine(1402)-2'-O)-methyltransferase [Candidatus Omnitrophota bacterium]
MLYIVSTPIGNLKDITFRAVEVLRAVDLIAAEDTRHSRILLQHYDIATPVTSYFEHNKFKKGEYLLKVMKGGQSVALVTDAGTPGISDPGFHLIRLARDNGVPVTVVPGPCALIGALSVSGLPAHAFVFEGFLPTKSAARRRKLAGFKDEARTVIFYESPHRLIKTLQDFCDVLDNPRMVCVRELTKKFEEVRAGSCQDLIGHFSRISPKGEFVLLLSQGAPACHSADSKINVTEEDGAPS